MYRGIQLNDWKIDISNPDFYIEHMDDNYHHSYSKWEILIDKIVSV